MIIRKIPLLAIVLLLSPSMTFAMDIDYYTYNGFQETVDAFNRVALIFANTNFQVLVGIGVFVSIGFGGLVFAYKNAAMGNFTAQPNFSWFFMPIVGFAFFKALTGSVGTVHVYDRVTNQYSPVGGVPVLITLIAYPVNMAERSMINIIDASSAYPYSSNAGGIIFDLLKSLSTETTFSGNTNISRSLRTFYKDCSPVAYANPGSYGNITIDQVRSQTPTDMMSTLAKMKSLSVSTVYYSDAVPAGETNTCAVAYDKIKADLDATALEPFRSTVCARIGLSTADAAQSMRCNSLISELSRIVFKNTGISSDIIFRNAFLSSQILEAMHEQDPEAAMIKLTSKNIMIEGFGTSTASGEWMPKIRASVFAMVLVIIPVIAMFIPTPFFGKALQLICVLLVWLAIWGVFDAAFLKIASDQAIAAMDEMVKHQQGVIAYLLAPESSMKALGLFGKARAMSIGLSSTICAIMFRMTTPFAQMAGNWSGTVDRAGTAAANQALDPTARAQATSGLLSAQAQSAEISNFGIEGMSAARQLTALQSTGQSIRTMDAFGSGPAYTASRLAAQGAGQTYGANSALGPTVESVQQTATRIASATQQGAVGRAEGDFKSAEQLHTSIGSQAYQAQMTEKLRQDAERKSGGGPEGLASIAARNTATEKARVDTLNNSPVTAQDAGQASAQDTLQNVSKRQELNRNGVTPDAAGKTDALNIAAGVATMDRIVQGGYFSDYVQGRGDDAVRTATEASARTSFADETGKPRDSTIENESQVRVAGAQANANAIRLQSDALGIESPYQYLLGKDLASQGPRNMTNDELRNLREDDNFMSRLNPDQTRTMDSIIAAGNGASVTLGQTTDGSVPYLTISEKSNVDTSQTSSRTISDSSAIAQRLDETNYLRNSPQATENVAYAMEQYKASGDETYLRSIASAMANQTQQFYSRNNVDTQSGSVEAHARADGKLFGIDAGASTSYSRNDATSQTTDVLSFQNLDILKSSVLANTSGGRLDSQTAAREAISAYQKQNNEYMKEGKAEAKVDTTTNGWMSYVGNWLP